MAGGVFNAVRQNTGHRIYFKFISWAAYKARANTRQVTVTTVIWTKIYIRDAL